jgi:hypothetical protein
MLRKLLSAGIVWGAAGFSLAPAAAPAGRLSSVALRAPVGVCTSRYLLVSFALHPSLCLHDTPCRVHHTGHAVSVHHSSSLLSADDDWPHTVNRARRPAAHVLRPSAAGVWQALTLAGCMRRKFMSSSKALDAKGRDSKVEQGDIGERALARVSCPTCECVTHKLPWCGRRVLHGRRRIQRCRRGR